MSYGLIVEQYLLGPEILRRSISGMSDNQLNASPIPFKWSAREVVLHLTDMDLIYADHMKRVIAEEEPNLLDVDCKLYGSRLAYDMRDVDEEVRLIKAMRRHMGRILRAIDADDFRRKGIHSVEGPLTLADLLQRATDHIPHHAQYIEEKRKALNIAERAIPFHLASVGVMKRLIA
jgi:uncharacterized damage-inducible protein DinB